MNPSRTEHLLVKELVCTLDRTARYVPCAAVSCCRLHKVVAAEGEKTPVAGVLGCCCPIRHATDDFHIVANGLFYPTDVLNISLIGKIHHPRSPSRTHTNHFPSLLRSTTRGCLVYMHVLHDYMQTDSSRALFETKCAFGLGKPSLLFLKIKSPNAFVGKEIVSTSFCNDQRLRLQTLQREFSASFARVVNPDTATKHIIV